MSQVLSTQRKHRKFDQTRTERVVSKEKKQKLQTLVSHHLNQTEDLRQESNKNIKSHIQISSALNANLSPYSKGNIPS